MLSYQHAYHAGNFADVHKHLVLHAVVDHLLRKSSPITFVDTHSGRGVYPLDAVETQRLGEFHHGALPLWEERHRLADEPLLSAWLEAIAGLQRGGSRLERYPGSPWWLAHRLRNGDRLRLYELHPGEHGHLSQQLLPANAQRIHGDGLAGLIQALPASTPRLCVLIDPSFERKEEYAEVAECVLAAMRKARHGVVLVWYPLLPAGRHHVLLERLREGGLRKIWRSELTLHAPGEERGMYGSGMLVVNPPWGLEERLAAAMARAAPLLDKGCRYSADWWVGE
ncbi:23S rRNA (adenine(2030)-N(6))-methyltransferase RlmJ [Billgrantia diversa]|uniref:23S rRNA (adenine(2030)-N(6))-methyltransferase RlmJ n=1 Tax=Halomonas sp. MCCC 1A13316 TaxID=2733487 RepID=UPI0018A6421A|nr:23S rRNA (adenine(2030)-N(6))-methyltransferase RlmJ [Halomonas sp. MCCC 1A13316]QOR40705.1 23S rRNA (adenine(2030)-N(6))-methyltransferase RlmJ [Halomonas sp. MCCC 1A13316]